MMIEAFHDVIRKEFPFEVRKYFVPAVKKGYGLHKLLINDNAFLQDYVGMNVYSRLRNISVAFALREAVTINKLPITCNDIRNPKNGHRRLELVTPNAIMTISQVKRPREVPRVSSFRKARSMNNDQMTMFDEHFGDPNKGEPFYFIMTHGTLLNQDLPDFVFLSAPVPGARKWVDQLPLHKEPFEIFKPDIEEIEESLPYLKEEIRKGVLGNG